MLELFKDLVEISNQSGTWKAIYFKSSPTARLEKWDGDKKEFEILVSKLELIELFKINLPADLEAT